MENRRHQKRYEIQGTVRIVAKDLVFPSRILDLSLNGALLDLDSTYPLQINEAVEIGLNVEAVQLIVAKARVAHLYGARVGVEFIDMSTRDFDVFSGLIEMLDQRGRIANCA